MVLNWQDLHHRELNTTQLYELLALRNAVFVVEQQCPYLDADGADLSGDNRHVLGVLDGKLVAYARILAPTAGNQPVKIGRVIIANDVRGQKLGYQLMAQAIGSCERYWPQHIQFLSAQSHLQAFYAQLGFVAVSDVYLEDGIPHIDMQRNSVSL